LLGRTVSPQYKTLQTTDRQMTDRETTQCIKGSTDSTVGQKVLNHKFGEYVNKLTGGLD